MFPSDDLKKVWTMLQSYYYYQVDLHFFNTDSFPFFVNLSNNYPLAHSLSDRAGQVMRVNRSPFCPSRRGPCWSSTPLREPKNKDGNKLMSSYSAQEREFNPASITIGTNDDRLFWLLVSISSLARTGRALKSPNHLSEPVLLRLDKLKKSLPIYIVKTRQHCFFSLSLFLLPYTENMDTREENER